MIFTSLFDAFTGLAAILACAVTVAVFLCLPKSPANSTHDWTIQPGRRRDMK